MTLEKEKGGRSAIKKKKSLRRVAEKIALAGRDPLTSSGVYEDTGLPQSEFTREKGR